MKVSDAGARYSDSIGRTSRVDDQWGTYYRREGWFKKPRVLDWRDKIRVGDILVEGTTPRIVRDCLYSINGILIAVDLVIQRCSWTRRCYTTIGRVDLAQRNFFHTWKQSRLEGNLDTKIDRAIIRPGRRHPKDLTCCAVEGLA